MEPTSKATPSGSLVQGGPEEGGSRPPQRARVRGERGQPVERHGQPGVQQADEPVALRVARHGEQAAVPQLEAQARAPLQPDHGRHREAWRAGARRGAHFHRTQALAGAGSACTNVSRGHWGVHEACALLSLDMPQQPLKERM
jgi:hypothetical protein